MDTLRGIKAAAMTLLVVALLVAALTLGGEPERQKDLAAELPSAAGVIEAAKENSAVISLPDSGLPPAGGEVLSLELSPELQEFDRRNVETTFFRNTKNRSKAVDYFNFYASLYGSRELMIQTQATLNVLVTYNCNFKPYFQEYSPMYGGREFTEKIEKTLYLWPQNNCNFIDVKEAIEQAWMNAPRESEPRSELERRIKRLYRTRRERWQRLAGLLGIKMPVAFRAYRGIRSHTFSPNAEMEALAEILAAWEETGKETMQMPGRDLNSWTLSKKKASDFAQHTSYINIVFEADILFENTLADMWVDGPAFNNDEKEILAGNLESGLQVPKKRITITYHRKEYTYETRLLLLETLKRDGIYPDSSVRIRK